MIGAIGVGGIIVVPKPPPRRPLGTQEKHQALIQLEEEQAKCRDQEETVEAIMPQHNTRAPSAAPHKTHSCRSGTAVARKISPSLSPRPSQGSCIVSATLKIVHGSTLECWLAVPSTKASALLSISRLEAPKGPPIWRHRATPSWLGLPWKVSY